ncbi:MAG: hypothetical protein AAGI88_23620 [Pseudomonadota bacterium]
MGIVMISGMVFSIAAWVWMALIACIAAGNDETLSKSQKSAQISISVLVPIFGAIVVLHLVHQHQPDAIPRRLVPWPFSSIIFGEPIPENELRDDRENPLTGNIERIDRALGGMDGD